MAGVGTLLWHTARCQESIPGPKGLRLEHRPVPSAGALHPIHVLLEVPGRPCWARYDPHAHALSVLPDDWPLSQLRTSATRLLDQPASTLLAFVAEPGLTSAKYFCPESLIWRDAGVLQGAICMIAPQAGLGACLLGFNGNGAFESLGQQGQLVGVGTAMVGAPAG